MSEGSNYAESTELARRELASKLTEVIEKVHSKLTDWNCTGKPPQLMVKTEPCDIDRHEVQIQSSITSQASPGPMADNVISVEMKSK